MNKISSTMPCLLIALVVLACSGCATRDVVSVGKDTYMVNRGGWPAMNGFECEKQCYQAANQFCASNHLSLVSTKPTTIDGAAFQHSASCKLVFVATNAPLSK